MKHLKNKLIFSTCLICSFLSVNITFAKTRATKQQSIKQGINRIIHDASNKKLHAINIGIIIQSMKSGKILYQHQANRLYTPASVLKLVTAAAAANYLTPKFRFHTNVLTKSNYKNGVLLGNLYIQFNGDPTLTVKDLDKIIRKLHHTGIYKVAGRIYIDNFAYNDVPYPPGWLWDDLSYSYAAPLDAIIINKNKFMLRFNPVKIGKRPQLKTELPPRVVRLINRMLVTKKHRKHCPITIYSNDQNVYKLGGCLNIKAGQQARILAIRNVSIYAKAIIKDLFKQNRIVFSRPIRLLKTPKGAALIFSHQSEPLNKIIKEMLKESDNLYTNSVLKKIGEKYFKEPGTWQNGLRAIKKILAESTSIDFKRNMINDGAGLSRYNLITPQQLSKLLFYIYRNKNIKHTILHALPIAGHDGTLEYRMRAIRKRKRVRAKTGSMTGVSALAGYINTLHNGTISFVIIINGYVGSRKPYMRLEDKICTFLVKAA